MMIAMKPTATERVAPYRLASAQIKHGEPSVLDIRGRKIDGPHFALIAGPCTVESRQQTLQTARVVRDAGGGGGRQGALGGAGDHRRF